MAAAVQSPPSASAVHNMMPLDPPPAYTTSPSRNRSSLSGSSSTTLSRGSTSSLASVSPSSPELSSPASPKRVGKMTSTFHKVSSGAGWPLNKAAHVVGAEGWWPSSSGNESDKAARILHAFTKSGAVIPPSKSGPYHLTGLGNRAVCKIPARLINDCAGLAIFNVARGGLFHGSVAAGSGVVVRRRPDGSWSPPSHFIVSTVGGGFTIGLDVYDCVCMLNNSRQVDAFSKPRVSLGTESSATFGPVGIGIAAAMATDRSKRPIFTYAKSRGFYAGAQLDGTVIVARAAANAVAYNEKGISARRILEDDDVAWPESALSLLEVLKTVGVPTLDEKMTPGLDAAGEQTEEEDARSSSNTSQQRINTLSEEKRLIAGLEPCGHPAGHPAEPAPAYEETERST